MLFLHRATQHFNGESYLVVSLVVVVKLWVSAASAFDPSAQHVQGSLWQSKRRVLPSLHCRADRRKIGIGMALWAFRTPQVLFTAEGCHRDWTRKGVWHSCFVVEDQSYAMRVGLVFVDYHDRPLPIRKLDWISSYQGVSAVVLKIAGRTEELVYTGTMLDPFEIDDSAGVILRSVSPNIEMFVGYEISVGTPAATTRTYRFRLNGRVIVDVAAKSEKRANAVAQPERRKDFGHRLSQPPGDVALGVDQRNACREAIHPPDF